MVARPRHQCDRTRSLAISALPLAQATEPVAWRSWKDGDGYCLRDTKDEAELASAHDFEPEPLYAAPVSPAHAAILTRQEIGEAWRTGGSAGVEKAIQNAAAEADARVGLTDEQRALIERAEERLRGDCIEDSIAANGLLEVLTAHPGQPRSRAVVTKVDRA